MNSLELSIVVPFYNAGVFLKRTLNTIKKQGPINYELIVVDDGSDSANKDLLMLYYDQIDLLVIQENRGQASARNAGIRKAKGEYILNWDADDYFEPGFSARAIKILKENPTIKLVTSYALRTADGVSSELIKPAGGCYQNFLFENAALGSAMFRKKDWQEIVGYDEANELRGYEDWDFYLRLLFPKGEAFIIPEQLFTYHRHAESTTSKILSERRSLAKRKYIYKKNKNIYQEHYPKLIEDLFYRLEREERERYKNLERIEYKLGYRILKPLRKLKRLFK